MKKIYLLLIFLFIVAFSFAQDNYIGIKGGANFVTQKFSSGGTSATPDRAIKPHFGIVYNAMVSSNIAIQPEIQYSGHGFEPVDNGIVDKIDYNYIAIPVMVKYYFNETVNLHAGPELGILVSGTEVNGVSITEETASTNLSFGIGLEVFTAGNIGFVGRYLAGISDIDDLFEELDQTTSNIQLSLVVKF